MLDMVPGTFKPQTKILRMWMLRTRSPGIASSIEAEKLQLNSVLLASVNKTDLGLFVTYRV